MTDVKTKQSRQELLEIIFDERHMPIYTKGIQEADLDYFKVRLKRLAFYQKSLDMFCKLMDSVTTFELENIYQILTDDIYQKYSYIKKLSDERIQGELAYEDLTAYDNLINKFRG